MTSMVIWMLVVLLPNGPEPHVLGAFTDQAQCEKTSVEVEAKLKEAHAVAVCSAYVPRDQS